MRIRNEQMKALSDYVDQAFEDRMVARFAARFASDPSTDEARVAIHEIIEQAEAYGIDEPDCISRYLELYLRSPRLFVGDTVDDFIDQTLTDGRMDGLEKIEEIEAYFEEEDVV